MDSLHQLIRQPSRVVIVTHKNPDGDALGSTLALAAVRATREGTVKQGRETLPVIIGTPIAGETIGKEHFDGETETAVFPGDLPARPDGLFDAGADMSGADHPIRFVRFRPPKLQRDADGLKLSLPHIRLDRALQFLIGDHLA